MFKRSICSETEVTDLHVCQYLAERQITHIELQ